MVGSGRGGRAASARTLFVQIGSAGDVYLRLAAALIMILFIEAVSGIATTSGRESGDRAPGDFGLDPLGYMKGDPAGAARLQAQEIANGRLAMWAAAGLHTQGCANHLGGVEAMTASLNANQF